MTPPMTLGLKSGMVRAVAESMRAECEKRKRNVMDTASACSATGFHFSPIVFEAHLGGRSTHSRHTLGWIIRHVPVVQSEDPHAISLKLAQRISVALHRENAQAILKGSAAA